MSLKLEGPAVSSGKVAVAVLTGSDQAAVGFATRCDSWLDSQTRAAELPCNIVPRAQARGNSLGVTANGGCEGMLWLVAALLMLQMVRGIAVCTELALKL